MTSFVNSQSFFFNIVMLLCIKVKIKWFVSRKKQLYLIRRAVVSLFCCFSYNCAGFEVMREESACLGFKAISIFEVCDSASRVTVQHSF